MPTTAKGHGPMNRHFKCSLVFVVPLAIVLASCGGGGGSSGNASSSSSTPAASTPASAPSKQGVVINNFKFAPATLTVKAGAHVAVANKDSTAHTATADDGKTFDTSTIDPGSSKTVTLSK